ncbi:DUF3667 domain-containing protein [Mucilaginibacter myungsuensis]|uniref:DUF3667 domain-containing protein n=1 Tax=Mucilaginibacter myungsuensis TaxID=649104 RepID=A0A929L0T4_9SPHI|nr:DUF3667 domain-containing protein [Mucilaginibacter myungsuensis]MBE9664150.1 DUF3667 domain-containing protein [Mucilaginibacter myungsuensis]MDN3599853.1 DUF3667 domain-containing protein [Mucilaginibacter myungsuensis]
MDCQTCGSTRNEKYCPACGEKTFEPHQLSLKEFVEELFEGFSHFDTKFIRTIKTLIFKPGQLSLEFCAGKRVNHMKPIQLFLVVNLIFFIAALHNLYSLELYNYINFKPFITFNTKQIINDVLAKEHTTLAEYTAVFNEKMKSSSKAFIFAFIPVYGVFFALFFFWKKKYFVEHLVFATHFMSFVLVMLFLGGYLIMLPYFMIVGKESADFDFFYSWAVRILIGVYAGFAIHRFYRTPIFYTLIIALVVGYFFFAPIQYYRMGLFYKITHFNPWGH